MADVAIRELRKAYGGLEVIHGVSLDIPDGQFAVLVGPSGCGKSTLLRMIAGLEGISGGTIAIGERVVNNLPPSERNIAMVFQNYALYPHKTVAANMSFALRMARMPKAEIDARVARAADILGLRPYLARYPRALSGGQRQRVAMGRAIVRDPSVFLFDEPLSNLDAGLRGQMRIEIGVLQRRLHTTTIYVTHDQVEAMTLGDRIVVLAQGRIQQVGRPIDLYRSPKNRFVAGFIGTPSMNFIDGNVRSENGTAAFVAEGVRIELPRERLAAASEPRSMGIRPEDLRIIPASGAGTEAPGMTGRVVLVERLGGTSHIHFDVGPHRLLALVSGETLPEVGDVIGVQVPGARVHLFGADGQTA